MAEPIPEHLELLAIDAFRVFGANREEWPDILQINRTGYIDGNIRGIWSLEERIEFYHFTFTQLEEDGRDEIATSPESSGGSE